MSATLDEAGFDGALADRLALPRRGLSLYWLGQAGFVIDSDRHRIVIDPYLSDSLARKYGHSQYPHARLMPTPAAPDDLAGIDLVLCTHRHTDHMDPDTLAPLAARHPGLRFVVPAAAAAEARARIGAGDDRLLPVDAGDAIEPLSGLIIRAVRAAHETLERDAAGRHLFLGYCLEIAGLRIFHSGDTIPFEGQREEVAKLAADLALLPVNGRSEELRRAGFAGNLTLDEAIALCEACGIPAMLAHHYGMFAFNTADPAAIDATASAAGLCVRRARMQVEYALRPG